MSPVLWALPAVLLGLLTAAVAVFWASRQRGEPLPADLPATPLQRRARWSAAVGMAVVIVLAVILATVGPDRALADDRWRIVMELLAVGCLVIVGVAVGGLAFPGWGPLVDERDRAILERASLAQVSAILVTLAAWVVYLMERFAVSRQVPVVFLTLIMWSCLLVAMLALPVGILLGYRRR